MGGRARLSFLFDRFICCIFAFCLLLVGFLFVILFRGLQDTRKDSLTRSNQPKTSTKNLPQNRYKDESYFWEVVLTTRKISVVAISVFGKSIGVQRQAQLALFILFVCISIEIAGEPYRIVTKRHKVLGQIELASLFVLFMTMWCGTLIFASQAPGEEGFVVFVSFVVAFINVALLLLMGIRLVAEYSFENKDSSIGKSFRRRMGSVQSRTGVKGKGVGNTGMEIEMTSTAEDSATAAAAAAAISASARWKSLSAVGRENAMYKETTRQQDAATVAGVVVSPNPLSSTTESAPADNWIRMFDATSSRWYFHDKVSGQSKWESATTIGASATPAAVTGNETTRNRSIWYSKFETDEGKAYFVPVSDGATVWELPEGAKLVSSMT